MQNSEKWAWWAGEFEDEYRLAGPCASREKAINDAYGCDVETGDTIFLIEARCSDELNGDDLYEFIATRNRSTHVVQRDDEDE